MRKIALAVGIRNLFQTNCQCVKFHLHIDLDLKLVGQICKFHPISHLSFLVCLINYKQRKEFNKVSHVFPKAKETDMLSL